MKFTKRENISFRVVSFFKSGVCLKSSYQTSKPRDGRAAAHFGAAADQGQPAQVEEGGRADGRGEEALSRKAQSRG